MGRSFLFSKGGEDWSKKRKASAHAFYKDPMEKMMETFKEKLASMVSVWNNEILASSDGKITIDIAQVFGKLFCSSIVHICFGEDMSDMEIDIDFRSPTNDTLFVRKTVNLA